MKKMTQRLEAGKDIAKLAEKGRIWVLVCFIGMFVLLIGDTVLFPTEGARTWVIVLFQTSLLILFIPGVWKRHPRSHAWLCFVSLFYFMQGTTQAFVPGHEAFGWILAILSMTLFCAAMMFSRWESMRIKALQTSSTNQEGNTNQEAQTQTASESKSEPQQEKN